MYIEEVHSTVHTTSNSLHRNLLILKRPMQQDKLSLKLSIRVEAKCYCNKPVCSVRDKTDNREGILQAKR